MIGIQGPPLAFWYRCWPVTLDTVMNCRNYFDCHRFLTCALPTRVYRRRCFSSGGASVACGLVLVIVVLVIVVLPPARTSEAGELPPRVTFNAHIRPIMSNTCFVCHGPDTEANDSGLRLDSFEAAIELSESIIPGNHAQSLVYQRITSDDDPMPPADFRHQLSDLDKALLRRWIEQGAEYEPHWSFASIAAAALPTPDHHGELIANEIDAFILKRLEAEGVPPSPLADKATRLRRLSLDIIGLPPTPAELSRYLADESAEAYALEVERLLASPHYGERMAAHWLDLVRFSDTVGFHGDQNQRIFPYRDYVIRAFHENKPFDQFTLEQLAGDTLPNPTEEQLVATGLLRLNMMTREGGAQPKEYLAKSNADRVRMLGTAWLGITLGCCECHHHKYDPLTIEDFYGLGAFFSDMRQWGVYTTYHYTPNPELPGFSNDHPFPPEMRIRSDALLDQLRHWESVMVDAAATRFEASSEESTAWERWVDCLADWLVQYPDGWCVMQPHDVSSHTETPHQTMADGSVVYTGPPQQGDLIRINHVTNEPMTIRSLRLEVLPTAVNHGSVGRSPDGRFRLKLGAKLHRAITGPLLVGATAIILPAKSEVTTQGEPVANGFVEIAGSELLLEHAQADRQDPARYSNGFESRYLDEFWQSGPSIWQLPKDEHQLPHTAIFHLRSALRMEPGDRIEFILQTDDVGCVRLAVSPLTRYAAGLPAATPELMEAAASHHRGESLSPAARAQLAAAFYLSNTDANQLPPELAAIRDEIANVRSGYAMTMISQRIPTRDIPIARVLRRGDWQDEGGDTVVPATPAFLPQLANPEVRRLNRIDLAHWLTSPHNPLPARNYVNRTWKLFFGTGLSHKLDDLGNQGEWPSHPALLDWLAADFRQHWDTKRLVRKIVMSRTYQQAAAIRHDPRERDPHNRLLGQQSARRLEAEIIRDNALAISGLLSTDMIGGPSIFPYQPDNYYALLQFPDRAYVASRGDLQYRRSVYIHWQRTFLHPMLANFDAPARDECTADRTESNSPQQALTLLNDPQFVEAANSFACYLLAEAPQATFSELLDRAFLRALARKATLDEHARLQLFFEQQLEHYTKDPSQATSLLHGNGHFTPCSEIDATRMASWSQVCRVILNLHETITRY